MRILLLALSLFVVQNTFSNDTIIKSMKAMAPGVTLSMVGGVVFELVYPIKRGPWALLNPIIPCTATAISALGMAITGYNLAKIDGQISPVFFVSFFVNAFFYCIACDGTEYIKKKLLKWYNKKEKTKNLETR